MTNPDMDFVTNARTALPRLLADLDRAEAKLQRVRQAAQQVCEGGVTDSDQCIYCLKDACSDDCPMAALRQALAEAGKG